MSKLPTGGYQPTNRPENLTLPNKGPSYKPKEEKTKVIWHPYPQEKPKMEGVYLATAVFGSIKEVVTWYFESRRFGNKFDNYVIAWAEMPKPYEDMKNV